jgi:hypothetical protein
VYPAIFLSFMLFLFVEFCISVGDLFVRKKETFHVVALGLQGQEIRKVICVQRKVLRYMNFYQERNEERKNI